MKIIFYSKVDCFVKICNEIFEVICGTEKVFEANFDDVFVEVCFSSRLNLPFVFKLQHKKASLFGLLFSFYKNLVISAVRDEV
jgi:hypothetical protein